MGHWLFAHKYFKISNVIEFFKKGQTVPDQVKAKDERVNKIFLSLNLVPALGMGVFECLSLNEYFHKGNTEAYKVYRKIFTICYFAVIILELLSALILGVGVLKLYRLAKSGELFDERINVPQLVLHVSAFVTYLMSVLIQVIFYAIFIWSYSPQKKHNWAVSSIVCDWVNMISQILLVAVLVPLTKDQSLQETMKHFGVPQVADFDEDAQTNMRIWMLLTRRQRLNEEED